MSSRRAFALFALASLIRAALAPAFDLMPQSAYYFTYAEHPSLSYYDHPPMIGWLLLASSALLGKSVLAVRGAVFVTTLGTQLALYALARRLAGPEAGARSLVLFSTGGVAVLLSFIAVPDVPLLLFWTAALLALHRAVFGADGAGAGAPRWWLAAGAAMGLALLSKYTAVFLQAGLVLFLFASREHRPRLRGPWPWAALAVAHAVALPVYVWNARHGFASFAYQSVGRASESRFDPADLFGFLASQAVVFLPLPFGAFLWVAGRKGLEAFRGRAPGARDLFLLSFSAPLFATCLALSTVTWVKSNWAMPAYVTGVILAASLLGARGVRWHVATAGLLHAALAVQLLAYPVPVRSDDTWYGWSELARRVEAVAADHPGAFVFSADNYKTTAELRFYGDLEAYGMNVLGWNALHFEYIGEDPEELIGRNGLLVANEPKLRPTEETERIVARARRHFAAVEELDPIHLKRRGETLRLLRVFLCRDYRGPVPAAPARGSIGP